MRALRMEAFALLAARLAFEWLSSLGRRRAALKIAEAAGPGACGPRGLAHWAAASPQELREALAGALRGRADQIGAGLTGFPEDAEWGRVHALRAAGGFGPAAVPSHSRRWARMLRSGAAGWGFALELLRCGAIDWRWMGPGQTEAAMRLALSARPGEAFRASARFLRRACLADAGAARQGMLRAWVGSGRPPEPFDAFWARRVERRLLARAACDAPREDAPRL